MNSSIRTAKVVNVDDIMNLIQALPLEQRERLITEVFASLPEESKKRILDVGGVNVVTGGSNFAVNASFCIQIQNAPNVDIPSIIEAAALRHRRDRESKY